MVYCDYVSHNKEKAIYNFGGDTEDITGVVEFSLRKDGIEVVSEPRKSDVPTRHLMWVYGRNRENFKNGIFPKKLAHEN